MKLYLLRNGETNASRTGEFSGSGRDGALTPIGERMAAEFAAAYQESPWRAIFSSSQQRAIATAMPLCKAVGLDLQQRHDLREIDYGRWEGLTHADVDRKFHDDYLRWLASPAWNPPTGGESAIQVARRVSSILSEIECSYAAGNVLLVAHKSVLRIVLCLLLGADVGRYRDRFAMPVATLTVVELARNGPFVCRFGDRSHLSPALQQLPGT